MSDATRCDYNIVVAAVTLFHSTGLGFNDTIRTIVAIENITKPRSVVANKSQWRVDTNLTPAISRITKSTRN